MKEKHYGNFFGALSLRTVEGYQWMMKFIRIVVLGIMAVVMINSIDHQPLPQRSYWYGACIVVGAMAFMLIARQVHLRWYCERRIYDCDLPSKLGPGVLIAAIVMTVVVVSGLATMINALIYERRIINLLEEAGSTLYLGAGVSRILMPSNPAPAIESMAAELTGLHLELWFMACTAFAIVHMVIQALEISLIELPQCRHAKLRYLEERGYHIGWLIGDYNDYNS